jgi:pyruvate/2-oxoglutarate/acetoin dehydrogenase E1 component
MSEMSFASAVNDALHTAMNLDSSVIFYGLGATDPKEIFGTTAGLAKKFGHSRVFDTPASERRLVACEQ